MSDTITLAIITGGIGLVGTIFSGIMAYFMAKLNKKADESKKVVEAVHVLVNSSMGAQLKISMIALHRVAELTKNTEDLLAADLAAKLFRAHEAKEKRV